MGLRININAKIKLFGFSVAVIPENLNIKIQKSKTAIIQRVGQLDWFECNGIKKTKNIILYKKVSHDFKTQEDTKNETLWEIGSVVTCSDWNPTINECGEGKFHGCSSPYFCDEFRNKAGDKYIAIKIKSVDLYPWENNPSYPYKIGFREGVVLYECDIFGSKMEEHKYEN